MLLLVAMTCFDVRAEDGEVTVSTEEAARRLADLIDPSEDQFREVVKAVDPTDRGLDSICEWCRSRLEGAGRDEEHMLCAIMAAIEDYRHPERMTAKTVRACDREALLRLAREMRFKAEESKAYFAGVYPGEIIEYADRISEACGEKGE